MSALDDVLRRCPASDEDQRRGIEAQFGIHDPQDLAGAVIFGTGVLGTALAASLSAQGLAPIAFSDNDAHRWHTVIRGLKVLPPADLDPRRPVLVASKFVKDIFGGLADRPDLQLIPHYLLPILYPDRFPGGGYHSLAAERIGAAAATIRSTYAMLADEESRALYARLLRFRITLDPADLPDPTPGQYFPTGLWAPDPDCVFVDVGACNGDTLADFVAWTGGEYERYYAYEPDPENLKALRRTVSALADSRVVVRPAAAGDRQGVLSFAGGRGGESRAAEAGTLEVEMVTLDEDLRDVPVTTVKVDVEGFERATLAGAQDLISRSGPRLALSVYHLVEDLWELPAWVAAHRSDYTCHLRHHTPEIYDTVLYCERERAS